LVEAFPEVDVRRAALSDRAEHTSFRWVKNLLGMSGLRERSYPSEPELEVIQVDTETLDAALPRGYVPSLVKIDVEGAELLVLGGGVETLRRHHPWIVFEYGRGMEFTSYETKPGDIYEFLTGLDYRIFDLDGNGPMSLEEFSATPCWNFVAHV